MREIANLSLPILCIIGIINGLIFYLLLRKHKSENENIKSVANSIKQGARTYQKRQYTFLLFTAFISATLIFQQWGLKTAIAFMVGTVFPLVLNLISLTFSLTSGEKLAQAFSSKSKDNACFGIIFKGGMLQALWILSFAFIGLSIVFYLLQEAFINLHQVISFSVGVCLFTLLERIMGGLVGEFAESERALIYQNEGNGKDSKSFQALNHISYLKYHINGIGSRGADFFDSLIAAAAAALILSSAQLEDWIEWMLLPFLLLAAGCISFLLVSYIFRVASKKAWLSSNLYLSLINVILLLIIAFFLVKQLELPYNCFWSISIGLLAGISIIFISKYYTMGGSVKGIAEASRTGAATNIITGLASGMRSTALPVLLLSIAMYVSFSLSSFYGIALSAISLSSTLIMASALNAWGSLALGSFIISQKSKKDKDTATQKIIKESSYASVSIGRGLSIATATLISYSLFAALIKLGHITIIDITRAEVVIGTFIGAVIPFLIASLAIIAVINITLQLKDQIAFLDVAEKSRKTEGNDFLNKIINLVYSSSRKQSIFPSLLIIVAIIYYSAFFGSEQWIAGIMGGVIFTGILLAFFMSYGGTSWESTVQYIERIHSAKSEDDLYKASLIGRLVGNPLQEVAGSTMNILIKFIPLLGLLLISLF